MTLHEVEQVEAGEFYLLVDPRKKSVPRYGVVQIRNLGIRWFKCWGDWIHVDAAIKAGMKFYGPVQLQPAQDGAGESEAG